VKFVNTCYNLYRKVQSANQHVSNRAMENLHRLITIVNDTAVRPQLRHTQ